MGLLPGTVELPLEGGSRNNSNFSKDFSYENVSQNESWGFWKGVGAPTAFSLAAQGRARGKEEVGPRLIRCLSNRLGAASQRDPALLVVSLSLSLLKGSLAGKPGVTALPCLQTDEPSCGCRVDAARPGAQRPRTLAWKPRGCARPPTVPARPVPTVQKVPQETDVSPGGWAV